METRLYNYVMEKADYKKIDKLLAIKAADAEGFFDAVRRLAKGLSDHGVRRYQILAEARFKELQGIPEEEY